MLPRAATFLGAFLLFELELLAAKLLLPFFGGSAQVWTASMTCFQALLLAGYAYGHAAAKLLPPRWHARAHLAVLGLSLLALPLAVDAPATATPALAVIVALVRSVGLPFVALSATVLTLQRMSVGTRGHPDGYVLYAYSNAGALAGLLAYPLVVEPLLSLPAQIGLWEALYALFILLHVPSALWEPDGQAPPAAARAARPSPGQYAAWACLAAGPCAAMLAATHLLSSDVAAAPFLWIVPLAIYLATLILNFGRTPWQPQPLTWGLAIVAGLCLGPVALFVVARAMLAGGPRMGAAAVVFLIGLVNVAVLFVVSMICHRSLALSKPSDPAAATPFYLALGFGGAAGGLLLSVLVPWLGRGIGWIGLDWLVAGAVCLAALVLRDWRAWRERGVLDLTTLAVAFGIVLAALFTARGSTLETGISLRNFYGIYRVVQRGDLRLLMHGGTLHGMQRIGLAEGQRPVPLAYYHAFGPVGDVYRLFGPGLRSVGAIGLGAGALAAYGMPGTSLTFFELDPDVIGIARKHFAYLERSRAALDVLVGDARLSLARRPDLGFDMLVIDAFNGGAIPTHLLTREAFELYFHRLAPGGLVLCHISNKRLDLAPMLAAVASDLGLSGAIRSAVPPPELSTEYYSSVWIALSKDPRIAAQLREKAGWKDLRGHARHGLKAWTDACSSLLRIVKL